MTYLKSINSFLWTYPMLYLLLGLHIFFTIRLRFPQKKILGAIHLSVQKDEDSEKGLSGFAALATTLAATLGTGNIVGVSTAIALGGPGAVFWCWITGILGMATSYAECYLSLIYRKKRIDGSYTGGPMYVLRDILKKPFLASMYAVCTILASCCIGCTTQVNAITETTSALWHLSPYVVGIIIALTCGFVIIGGVTLIGKVCEKLVPVMGAFYIICCLALLFINRRYLLDTLSLIFHCAFHAKTAACGFAASTIQTAARYGIARGLFTNEAGLGSSAIAASNAATKNPQKQALIQMTATFWDTVVMCAITGIVIVSGILRNPDSFQGCSYGNYTSVAFQTLPFGSTLLAFALIAFAVATLIGWSFFGERALEFLSGNHYKKTYQTVYIVMIFLGAILSLDLVWEMTDFINALLIIPNVSALLLLRKKIKL